MEKFPAEVFGTGALIILGDGVVAGVLLARSKAQNAGWIVITMGWGLAVMVGVVRRRTHLRGAPQPGGHPRHGVHRVDPVERRAVSISRR